MVMLRTLLGDVFMMRGSYEVGFGARADSGSTSASWPRASAPPTISMISVVMESWRARFMTRVRWRDELLGVVGGRLHGPLAGGVLRRRGVEQGGVDAGLDVAGQERLEDRRRVDGSNS